MRARNHELVSDRKPREPSPPRPSRGPIPLAEALDALAARLFASAPRPPRLQSRRKGGTHGNAL